MQLTESERLRKAVSKIKETKAGFNFTQYFCECLEELTKNSENEETAYIQRIIDAKKEVEIANNRLKKREEEYQAYILFREKKEKEKEEKAKQEIIQNEEFEKEKVFMDKVKVFLESNREQFNKGYKDGLWATPKQFYLKVAKETEEIPA